MRYLILVLVFLVSCDGLKPKGKQSSNIKKSQTQSVFNKDKQSDLLDEARTESVVSLPDAEVGTVEEDEAVSVTPNPSINSSVVNLVEPVQPKIIKNDRKLILDYGSFSTSGERLSFSVNCFVYDKRYSYKDEYRCDIDPLVAYSKITVEPKVSFTVRNQRRRITLVGDFKPSVDYKISFNKGLTTRYGYQLSEDYVSNKKAPNFSKSFQFLSKSRYVPRSFQHRLKFKARNYEKVKLKVYKIIPRNTIFWLMKSESIDESVAELVSDKVLNIKSKDNYFTNGEIELDLSVKAEQGVYAIQAIDADSSWENVIDSAQIVISDMLTIAKSGDKLVDVWVKDLKSLDSMSGVKVDLRNKSNRTLSSCNTGSDGHCLLELPIDEKAEPYAIIFGKDDDYTHLKFSDLKLHVEPKLIGSKAYPNPQMPVSGYLYSGRTLFRPGDEIPIIGVFRGAKIDAQADIPVELKITDPRSREIYKRVHRTNESGLTETMVYSSIDSPTGAYNVSASIGGEQVASFRYHLEEFMPERIKITIDDSKVSEIISASDLDPTFPVAAEYLFGGSLANAPYNVNCRLGSRIRNITSQYVVGPLPSESKKFQPNLKSVNEKLNEKGEAEIDCNIASVKENIYGLHDMTLRIEVNEAGSPRPSVSQSKFNVARSDRIVGLRSLGDDLNSEVQLFGLDRKKKMSSVELKWHLFKNDGDWRYTYDSKSGRYKWDRDVVLLPVLVGKTLKLNEKGFAKLEIPKQSYGQYILKVEDPITGDYSQMSMSSGYSWWYSDSSRGNAGKPLDPDELVVRRSKKVVKVGDSFELEFDAPFAGEGLVTLESTSVLSKKWIKFEKGNQKISMTAPDQLPGVYATVLLFRKNEKKFLPTRAWGITHIGIEPTQSVKMPIEVSVANKVMPGKSVEVKVKGSPNAHYTVSMVDEGILQLRGDPLASPYKSFFQKRKLATATFESMGWTMANGGLEGAKGNQGGGAGLKSSSARQGMKKKDFAVFWSGLLKLDSQGNGVVSYTPPSAFQGTLSINAVAAGLKDVGAKHQKMKVTSPVVAQVTLPRFVHNSNKIVVPIFASNTTKKTQNVSIKIKASKHLSGDTNSMNLKLLPGKSETVLKTFQVVGHKGKASLDIDVKGSSFSYQLTEKFPIFPKGRQLEYVQMVKASELSGLKSMLPDNFDPSIVDYEVQSSKHPALLAFGKVDQLVKYPHGCIEQTSSKTFPLVAIDAMMKNGKNLMKPMPKLKEFLEAGISRIISMQRYDGSFSYWPGASHGASDYGTVYAAHLLVTAKNLGHDISDNVIKSSLDYLEKTYLIEKKFSRNTSKYNYDYKKRNYHMTRPYGLFVLALGGRKVMSPINDLILQQSSLKDLWGYRYAENNLLIYATLIQQGAVDLAKKWKSNSNLLNASIQKPKKKYGAFWSPLRSLGFMLAVSEQVNSNLDRTQLIIHLSNKLVSKKYLSTQELGWSLLGIALYSRGIDLSTPSTDVKLAGSSLQPSYSKGAIKRWSVDQDQLDSNLEASGKGYFLVKMRGFEKDGVAKQSNNFTLKRTIYDIDGNPVNKFEAGKVYAVKVEVKNNTASNYDYFAITDYVPAGLEIENSRLKGTARPAWMDEKSQVFNYVDVRDERISIYGNLPSSGSASYYYLVRPTTRGKFVWPGIVAEPMYLPHLVGVSPHFNVEVN